MALSELQAIQLANLLAGHSKVFTANNPGQNEFANFLLQSGQAAQQGLLAEEEEKKRKKEKKAKTFGKLGNMFGSIPGTLAYKAAGGSDSIGQAFAQNTIESANNIFGAGQQGQLAKSVETATTQPDIPASPTMPQKIEGAVAKAMPPSNTLSPGTIAPGALANVPPPQMPQGVIQPPLQQPGAAGVATASPQAVIGASGARRYNIDPQAKMAMIEARPDSPKQPGFFSQLGSGFGSALLHQFRAQPQQAQQRRVVRYTDGREVPY